MQLLACWSTPAMHSQHGCRKWQDVHGNDVCSLVELPFARWGGAQAIVTLGELDCRSGLLAAVHKGVHPSLHAAIQSLVQLYCTLLESLLAERQLAALYVCSVPPVMPETRCVVMAFNSNLEQQVSLSQPPAW